MLGQMRGSEQAEQALGAMLLGGLTVSVLKSLEEGLE